MRSIERVAFGVLGVAVAGVSALDQAAIAKVDAEVAAAGKTICRGTD